MASKVEDNHSPRYRTRKLLFAPAFVASTTLATDIILAFQMDVTPRVPIVARPWRGVLFESYPCAEKSLFLFFEPSTCWTIRGVDAQVWDAHAGLNGGCECESAVRARFEALQDRLFQPLRHPSPSALSILSWQVGAQNQEKLFVRVPILKTQSSIFSLLNGVRLFSSLVKARLVKSSSLVMEIETPWKGYSTPLTGHHYALLFIYKVGFPPLRKDSSGSLVLGKAFNQIKKRDSCSALTPLVLRLRRSCL